MPKKTAVILLILGAHYLLGLKDNQPTLHQLALAKFARLKGAKPHWASAWEKGHGRRERRLLSVVTLDEQISSFPGARQILAMTREWYEAGSEELKSETRIFITSLEEGEKSLSQLAAIVRGHWAVENKNHWRRDTSLWKEDASRPRKKSNGAKNLALLRGAVLRLLPLEELPSLSGAFNANFAHRWPALKLLKSAPPQIN